jgi:hypothetical protein
MKKLIAYYKIKAMIFIVLLRDIDIACIEFTIKKNCFIVNLIKPKQYNCLLFCYVQHEHFFLFSLTWKTIVQIMPAKEGYIGNCHPENSPVNWGIRQGQQWNSMDDYFQSILLLQALFIILYWMS